MKKIYRIILGWWYFLSNKNNTLARERLKICVDCDKMSKGVCTLCGCVLQAKARIKEEECPLGKWIIWSRNFTGTISTGDLGATNI